ncbi:hypothetical protein BT93_L5760 [Corymbia citriodora subsp. variegata]|uniref:Disease resistance RPP13-like protein 1 n=1 Tax=Corymbia citriodora subsp. variegata TaxID=360336 RepID=A0A8T0CRE3_CORYI|nr:hypothetical protein BT93_L5760 [Corymbia citriodora subsp. variegata]
MVIGEIVLGSFLASFFQVLFDKLASLSLGYAQQEGINIALLEEWKGMLVTINAVLDDAEDKQLSGNHLVKLWLDDVRDLAYDMEDLFDEIAIKADQIELEAKSSTNRGMESGSNPNLLLLVSEAKVRKINSRLEAIVTNKARLSLIEKVVDRSNYTYKKLPSTSLPEPQFFGREKEEAQILELLTHDVENSDATLSIIPIVGMGGVGKTALAQRLYEDAKVKSCFERRAWVCVSDVFDVLNITKTILQSVTGSSSEGEDLNGLQVKLKDKLFEKKFLVVLDDIWNEKYDEWTALLKPFEAGAKGSKIIITTRNLAVVSITGASPYSLKELSIDNCTSLFAFHALGATNFERHLHLESIGKEIAKRCKGLPLAAKMLGGALRNKSNLDEWQDALNSIIWDLPKGGYDDILPVLKLSYIHLPSYLKRCFSYCAVFPKDYEIERDELVLLWIAEGFLERRNPQENILKLGRNHFDELVSRSFLQQSSNASKFTMHDLLNDLAKSIMGETHFSSRESQLANNDNASLQKARYASFISPLYELSKRWIVCHRMKVLRSLIVGSGGYFRKFSISDKGLHDLLTKLKYLRVFSVCHFSIKKVPSCLGDLKHLRYLNFSYTDIQTLPESIGTLYKLQALILRGCRMLSMLPPGITKLVNLQFLDIRDTIGLERMPLGIGNLKNLTILPKFVVGIERGLQLNELKNLPHLQGELFISELQNVEEVKDVHANLFGKQGLSNLYLHWSKDFGNRRKDKHEARVLDSLQPHTNLKSLTILYYGGAEFPPWLDGPSYSKLVTLCLKGCYNITSLSPLGQLPSLKELSLEGLDAIRMIGSEFYGGKRAFASLTKLKFEEMLTWKDWSPYVGGKKEEVPFSCLQHLVIQNCPSLIRTMPRQLDRLIKLDIYSCPHLNNSTNEVCLPSLHELSLGDCDKEILKSLVNLTSLTTLEINQLAELVCFDHGFMSSLVKLKTFWIGWCDKLTYLCQDGNELLNLTCLHGLTIQCCPRFTSFVAGEGEIVLPCSLDHMHLINCTSLEKLPSKMHTIRQLFLKDCPKLTGVTIPPNDPSSNNPMYQFESLSICKCDSLTSFPFARSSLVAMKKLHISNCEGVESLEEFTVQSLESLEIKDCNNLKSLPQCLCMLSHLTKLDISDCLALEIEDFPPLPITLSSLRLNNCPKVKSIASCDSLTDMYIKDCPALEVEHFPPLPTTLSSFYLNNCPKIKSLPNQWHHLTSLHELYVYNCPNIKCFPKGALPPNLWKVAILGCENVKQSLRQWGYHRLTSLRWLQIDGNSVTGEGDNGWFPSEDEDAWSLFFPSSLFFLQIINMKDVERLSSGLRNHLASLHWLQIYDCPKLRDLPEDGFPPSLERLSIYGSEILEDRCAKHTGDYWPLIQEIPGLNIG